MVKGVIKGILKLLNSPFLNQPHETIFTMCRLAKVNPKNSVPVLHDCETGKYICDSEEISDYLEEKYPHGMHGEGAGLGKSNNCPKV